MSKVLIFLLLIFSFLLLGSSQPVLALSDCKAIGIYYTMKEITPVPENRDHLDFYFNTNSGNGPIDIGTWRLKYSSYTNAERYSDNTVTLTEPGQVVLNIKRQPFPDDLIFSNGNQTLQLQKIDSKTGFFKDECNVSYTVGYTYNQCQLSITPSNPTTLEPIRVSIKRVPARTYQLLIGNGRFWTDYTELQGIGADSEGNGVLEISPIAKAGPTQLNVSYIDGGNQTLLPMLYHKIFCTTKFDVRVAGGATPRPLPPPGTIDEQTQSCTGNDCTTSAGISCDPKDPQVDSKTGKPTKPGNGVYTAIGCIPTEPTALIQGIIKFAIGAGGGIALLLMIYGAFQMITSGGNPDGVKKGHEQITSAVIGLLFIIFAVMLLKIIGVDILQIPGFS